MVSFCSVHQDASHKIHVDLEVTLRSCDLRSTVDLDLISNYSYFDAYRCEDLDGTAIFALTRLIKKLLAKSSLVSLHLLLLPL